MNEEVYQAECLQLGSCPCSQADSPACSLPAWTCTTSYPVTAIIVITDTLWLGSRVVSVLDSGAEGPGFKSQLPATLSGNSLRQTVHTHRASVHQAAKLVAALLRVAGVTVGLA